MAARRPFRPNAIAVAICFLAIVGSGCASTEWVKLRETPRNPLSDQLSLLSWSGPKPSDRTMQLLRRLNLEDSLDGDRAALLARLSEFNSDDPNRELVYAIAELAYVGAKRAEGSDGEVALELYGSAVIHTFEYLFDDTYADQSNPYDPQFRKACDLYNGSLEGLLRLVQRKNALRPGTTALVQTANRQCELTVKLISDGWHDEDFDRFEFVSDYKVKGLRNHYHRYGLGVPLIAIHKPHEDHDPAEQYYPPQLSFAVTALLRVTPTTSEPWPPAQYGENGGDRKRTKHVLQATLELHDPLGSNSIRVGSRRVPLETDLSTPLAHFLSQPEFSDSRLSTLGLLMPDEAEKNTGLYMLEPFQHDKMPVVMVHGLWSSPVTWMEMFNDLRGDPRIRDHYQFWFYLYPSGEPFWFSAARMRKDLAEARTICDPAGQHAALDQTVLVGHSMGGLVSKLQTVDSGNAFWATVSEEPLATLRADDDVRDALARTFYFQPNPSIRRIVTIGTPHRGSHVANDLTRWLGRKAISLPARLMRGKQQIVAQNPGLFQENNPLDISTSIDSLAPSSAFFPVLLSADKGQWVQHHNIIGRVSGEGIVGRVTELFGSEGDGVVSLASAKLDDVESELVVPADHTAVHRHPASILEVRRILLQQIDDLRRFPATARSAEGLSRTR